MKQKCNWKYNGEFFDTECKENFYFDHDIENYLCVKFKFCPFCGNEIEEGKNKKNEMTVKEIVLKYLEENGYDGLCNPDMMCGCGLDYLMICDDMDTSCCRPAYKNTELDCDQCISKNECFICENKFVECYTLEKKL